MPKKQKPSDKYEHVVYADDSAVGAGPPLNPTDTEVQDALRDVLSSRKDGVTVLRIGGVTKKC